MRSIVSPRMRVKYAKIKVSFYKSNVKNEEAESSYSPWFLSLEQVYFTGYCISVYTQFVCKYKQRLC